MSRTGDVGPGRGSHHPLRLDHCQTQHPECLCPQMLITKSTSCIGRELQAYHVMCMQCIFLHEMQLAKLATPV